MVLDTCYQTRIHFVFVLESMQRNDHIRTIVNQDKLLPPLPVLAVHPQIPGIFHPYQLRLGLAKNIDVKSRREHIQEIVIIHVVP